MVRIYSMLIILGYDSPFLTMLFGKQMSIILFTTLISVPVILFSLKYLKKVPFIYNKMKATWDSFFWNAPIRTFTELFIEISLGFFLNTLNVSVQNIDKYRSNSYHSVE